MTTPDTPTTGEEYLKAQEAEWGRYRANRLILIDGTPAFAQGDPVPVGHVKRGVVPQEFVDDVNKSKSAAEKG